MMIDYRAIESTQCEAVEVRQETSVREQLDTISKMLYETDMCLKSIILNLTGIDKSDDSLIKEEKCLEDSIITIHKLSDDCMATSKRIREILF